ncbi:hypothetical protein C1H76_6651 [Elsinoe australis]|uniref:Uncharacterized protein n=1 Tax=Elsinoe australis TaxID=40998 RepID=A0A4U7AWS7_9PEZI|nr:hypothetical protein C1H76_6651 [Elsinoe australis]
MPLLMRAIRINSCLQKPFSFPHNLHPAQSQSTKYFHPSQITTNPNSINMSAPNADKPNEGIVGQISNSVSNAANYVSETIQGKGAEASKEANKEQAKGNVAGQSSVSDRVSGALGAASDKMDQTTHESSAKANKHSV